MGQPSHYAAILSKQHGNDRYSFRDKTDTIAVIIPAAVLMAAK
jgi:uncharacterized protein YdeI (BOF family)